MLSLGYRKTLCTFLIPQHIVYIIWSQWEKRSYLKPCICNQIYTRTVSVNYPLGNHDGLAKLPTDGPTNRRTWRFAGKLHFKCVTIDAMLAANVTIQNPGLTPNCTGLDTFHCNMETRHYCVTGNTMSASLFSTARYRNFQKMATIRKKYSWAFRDKGHEIIENVEF